MRGAEFVVESVTEDLLIKRETFNAIDALAPEGAILASNTSMLTISDIGKDVKDKGRLVVTHWFNPPYLIPVVEVVKGAFTSQDTVERTIHLLEKIGKLPVRILKEVPGSSVKPHTICSIQRDPEPSPRRSGNARRD